MNGATLQALLFVFSGMAVLMSQDRRQAYRRYACIFGLISQPFWLGITFGAEQWGMFALSVFYTFAWARGFYINWIKP